MKRFVLSLACTAALVGVGAPATASAQQQDPTGSEAAYPPSYFKDRKPEVVAPRKRAGATSRSVLAGKWGWIHITRKWSANTAKKKARSLRDTALTQGALTAILGLTPGSKAVLVAFNIIEAYGTNKLSNRIGDANLDSNGRGVKFEAGLWCYDVPVIVDPCRPRISINSR